MPGPICEGLNVVELGSGSIAASLAGMMLADNGARVVKLEPPEGDALRTGSPSGFLVWNRGKDSVRVRPAHRRRARRASRAMAEQADVLIVGLAPGRADEWGLDDESLRAANPGLVYCSITGFGSTGPYARLKAYEGVVQAKIGAYSRGMFGFRDGPVFAGAPTASTGAAHMAVSGILAALIARETTGRGQRVDTSLVQGMIPADYFGIYHVQLARARPPREPATVPTPRRATGWPPAATRSASARRTAAGSTSRPSSRTRRTRSCAPLGLEGTLEEERFSHAPFFATAEDAQEWEDMLWERVRAADLGRAPAAVPRARTTSRSSCAARAKRRSTTRRSSPTAKSSRSTTRCSARCGQVGPLATFAESPSVITRSAPALGAGSVDALTRDASPRRTAPRRAGARAVGRDDRGVRLLLRDAVRRGARGGARRARHQARRRRG